MPAEATIQAKAGNFAVMLLKKFDPFGLVVSGEDVNVNFFGRWIVIVGDLHGLWPGKRKPEALTSL